RPRDLAGERGRDALVGIDRQHPVALRERQRKVLLRPEAMPVVRLDARTPLARERDGAVGAAGIDHDALVAEHKRVEAGADVRLLVLGDHDGAQTRQRISPIKSGLHLGPAFGDFARLAGCAGRAERRTMSVVEWPGTRSTSTTSPPSASTTSRPTTSSL